MPNVWGRYVRYVYTTALQRSILKNQNQNVNEHKFWLISVFVTNAKGGDCWHYFVFFIVITLT